MKILYTVSTLKRSGPINIVKSVVKYIDKEENDLYILSLSSEPVSSIREEFIERGIKCLNLNVSRKNIFLLLEKFKQAVKTIKPDIVHSHGLRPDILSVLFLKNKYRCCCTIHNYAPLDYKMKYGKILGKIASYIHLKVIKKISYPIACSESIASQLIKHNLNVDIIQNGVDIDYFIPSLLEKKKLLRKNLFLDLNSTIFIFVGTLIPRKNPLFILEAFSKYKHNFTLLLIGDGVLRSKLEFYSRKLKRNVIFTGNVSNVKDYLQTSDYFISASKSEGLPNTVLEASAVGLPLLLSDILSHKDILSKDRNAGYTFITGDVNSLISVLNNLQANDSRKYQEMSESARELIVNNFNAEEMSKKYQNFYKKMVSENPMCQYK